MKKKKLDILLAVAFAVGVLLILYPYVSRWLSGKQEASAIVDYKNHVESAEDEHLEDVWKQAFAYNEKLAEDPYAFYLPDRVEGYRDTLRVGQSDVIGQIRIPRLDMVAPLYHSVDEAVLQMGIGHMEGTSLPTGGEGNNCVLMGHRGLPNAKLFTELDKMEVGDRFTLEVLDKTMTYEVDEISTIDPKNYEKYKGVEGKDYCTLVTCTPYGLNTERLVVRGHRTE